MRRSNLEIKIRLNKFNPAEEQYKPPNTKVQSSTEIKLIETSLPQGFDIFLEELEKIAYQTIDQNSSGKELNNANIGISCTLIKMYQTAIEVYFWRKDKKLYSFYKDKLHKFIRKPHMREIINK